jgi:hypothetical protein
MMTSSPGNLGCKFFRPGILDCHSSTFLNPGGISDIDRSPNLWLTFTLVLLYPL